jgi:hypothetical protein
LRFVVEEKKSLEEKLRAQVDANKDLQAELQIVKASCEKLRVELADSAKVRAVLIMLLCFFFPDTPSRRPRAHPQRTWRRESNSCSR